MHIGNLQGSAGRLQEALETLQLAWQRAADHWRDERSQAIEEECLRPLAQEVNAALPAISHMAQVLAQAARECNE
jgi:hypothetical protein